VQQRDKNVTKEEVEYTIKVLKEDREKAEAKRAKKQDKNLTIKTNTPGTEISVPV